MPTWCPDLASHVCCHAPKREYGSKGALSFVKELNQRREEPATMKFLMLVRIDPEFKPGQDEGAPDVDD